MAENFPCATSTLHLENGPDEDYVNRFEKPEGDCLYLARALEIGFMGVSDDSLILGCPRIMAEMHEKGASREINCVAQLAMFAEATKD